MTSPSFHERVLEHLAAAVLVLDSSGNLAYANAATFELTGWTPEESIGTTILNYLHPDDLPWVTEAFGSLISTPTRAASSGASARTGVRFRILDREGGEIPVESMGGGGVDDEAIGGPVFVLRPARDDSLLDTVLGGIATGAALDTLITDILSIVTNPPIRIDAAIHEQRADGTSRVVASTHGSLDAVPMDTTSPLPWTGLATEPGYLPVADLPPAVGRGMVAAGFTDCFHARAHAPDMSRTLRIVACTYEPHRVRAGIVQRIERARELMSMVLSKQHNDRMLADEAARDALTGLPNRAGLVGSFDRIRQAGGAHAVMFVDLDGFKEVNDQRGHAVGDQVLATVADRLRRAVRFDDVVARLGGDEFALLLNEPSGTIDDTVVRRLADRVVEMLSEPVTVGESKVAIGASVGIARVASDEDLDQALWRADSAMYHAKRTGGRRHVTSD